MRRQILVGFLAGTVTGIKRHIIFFQLSGDAGENLFRYGLFGRRNARRLDEELLLFTVTDTSKFHSTANDTLYDEQGPDAFAHEQDLRRRGRSGRGRE